MIAWKVLVSVKTEGGELQLRQRGPREFWITIDGRVLMNSTDHVSEDKVATLALAAIGGKKSPHVLIGGLGMGFTLRAALDALPADARVTVAELTPEVETMCRGPLAELTNGAVLDPRVTVVIDDVARVITAAKPGSIDAIILDLYEGPSTVTKRELESVYGRSALLRSFAALSNGGAIAIWSEDLLPAFERTMKVAGFETSLHKAGGVHAYGVYLGKRGAARSAVSTRAPRRRR